MKAVQRSLIVYVAVMACFDMTAHAQNREARDAGPATEEEQALTDDVQLRIMELLSDPAVEGVAADVDNLGATFAIVRDRTIPLGEKSRKVISDLASDPAPLYSQPLRELAPAYVIRVLNVEKYEVLTGPLRVFGVAVGGSTSNEAGCFEGTVGAYVVDRSDRNLVGYLTCNHVAAAEGPLLCPNAREAREVAPATKETGCHPGEAIGRLLRIYHLDFRPNAPNRADAAFVQAKGVQWDDKKIKPDGTAYHFRGITAGLPVRKLGAGSGYTDNGIVERRKFLIRIPFIPCGPTITFVRQILVKGEGFAVAGDSGSMVYDNNGKAVGLIFAGDEAGSTFLSPAGEVLDLLGIDLIKRP
ncbi:MAG TPA: hypothetical protein VN380_21180 [Thermoanaerobaculia bacterium]|jgi:hypothetical protein|nr:hypothetical protein [Thermoanaerobaculia bacterium]